MLGTTNFANLTLADPIVLDLGAPGLAFASGENSVSFDINADGVVDQMAWTAGEDGILALDRRYRERHRDLLAMVQQRQPRRKPGGTRHARR